MNSSPDLAPALLTPEAAARYLSVSRALLYELLRANAFPSVKIQRARRIPRAALDAYIEDLMASST